MRDPIAIILAAGEGKRMGQPKALLEHEKGKSFLEQLISTFGKAGCQALVVVGNAAEQVQAQHPRAELVENPDWQRGQFSSVKVGLQAALRKGSEVLLLHPVDMPLIRPTTVSALVKELRGADGVVPEFEGAAGHPLVLTRAAAEQVLAMDDVPHLEAAQQRLNILRVKTKDPAVMVNINTPEIYERLLGSAPHSAPPPKKRGTRKAATPTAAGPVTKK